MGSGLCPSAALGVKEESSPPYPPAVVITGAPRIEEGKGGFTVLEHGFSQGGAGVHVHLHECPSPACRLPCLLALSGPACGQPTPPCVVPLVASLPHMVMLGVAEAGKFGFVFSSPARWFRRRPGELEGYKTVLVPAEPRSPPWSHQDEKSHAYYCRTTKTTRQWSVLSSSPVKFLQPNSARF